ncbi:MAG TPA: alpha-isopropylmalate synthase regulatory domain-containing protein, partial [Synergistales bacterium]|nr:alpha-isopropylmalate synthase regulatory domain-containing protein [Synergistales bacterium]
LGGVRVNGRGASTDVIEASIKAYIDGINRLFAAQARIAGQEAQAAEEARKAV